MRCADVPRWTRVRRRVRCGRREMVRAELQQAGAQLEAERFRLRGLTDDENFLGAAVERARTVFRIAEQERDALIQSLAFAESKNLLLARNSVQVGERERERQSGPGVTHTGGGNARAFKQPTWPYDIESGPGGLTREVETPLPSNSPRCDQLMPQSNSTTRC